MRSGNCYCSDNSLVMNDKGQPTGKTVSQDEYEILAAFRYALRQFLRFSENAAREVGLTPRQHQALLAIKGFPTTAELTIGELAEQLQLRHHSVVGLVDRLEAQSLVTREQGEDDRRQVYVRLTAEGERIIQQLSTAHKQELRRIKPQIWVLLEQLGGGDNDPTSVIGKEND